MFKKILITGSSSGIGREVARSFLSQGHQVIGIARDHSKFSDAGDGYIPYQIDLAKIDNLEKQFKAIGKEHADIDILFCNAAIGKFKNLEQFAVNDILQMINLDLTSQILLVRAFLPIMKKNNKGLIIFTGSECALNGYSKASIYAAAKFGLRGFAQSLRAETAKSNIKVTMLNPGLTRTNFHDQCDFKPAKAKNNAIEVSQIVKIMNMLSDADDNVVIEEINLQPQNPKVEF
jgi:3-hydroxy acid dehydrogenase / malonic semialdehyde reductase